MKDFFKKNLIAYVIVGLGLIKIIGHILPFGVFIKLGSLLNIAPAPAPFRVLNVSHQVRVFCSSVRGESLWSTVDHHSIYKHIKSQHILRTFYGRFWLKPDLQKKFLEEQFCNKEESIYKKITDCSKTQKIVKIERILMENSPEIVSVECAQKN